MSDLRLALRSLLRSPAFSAMAIVALALGVGLTTVVFAVIDTVILRPLPFANAERLVMVWHRYLTRDWGLVNLSYLTFSDLSEEEEPGAPRTVVIGYDLWQTRFGGSAALPGGTVVFDGEPHVVVGIMPPGFQFPPTFNQVDAITRAAPRPAFWTPLTARDAPPQRQQPLLLSLGTLKIGVSLVEAQAEVDVIALRLAESFPDANADLSFTLIPLHEQVPGVCVPLSWFCSVV